jgi:thiamine biosynthesis lipoprotein
MSGKTVKQLAPYYIFLIILCSLLLSCETKETKIVKRTQFIMGTLVEITVRATDNDLAHKAIDKSFDEMSRLEKIMSTRLPESELSKLNLSTGNENKITVSSDLLKVIQLGVHWGDFSNGAIDISIGPAVTLWKFNSESPALPDPEKLKTAVDLIDYQNISIDRNSISLKNAGMSLHLGALGKGYAVDRAVDFLKSSGIKNGLVNAGGDLMAFGSGQEGKPWRIGLQHPRKPEAMIASLDLADKAVATSGDYQRYFIRDGKRYHHILNPKDGEPAENVMSATVIADTVADADALSTALFVLGPEKGINLIDSLDGVEGMVITKSGSAFFTSGFNNLPGLSLQDVKNNLSQ